MPEAKTPDILALWGKTDKADPNRFHPLLYHMLDVAAVSLALPNPVARDGWSPRQIAYLVGLHDIGKADGRFQHQVEALSGNLEKMGFGKSDDAPCRHERLSAKFIRERLRETGHSERDADTIGRAVLAHHGYWDEVARPVGEEYHKAQGELSKILSNVLELPDVNVPILDHSAFGMRLAGHIVLCDWIASNEKFFTDRRLRQLEEPSAYFEQAKEVAREWVDRLSLKRADPDPRPHEIVEGPRPIQQALLDNEIPPGLVIIEAPMGQGKTEAAWILAEKWREHGYTGMYMALPTMATSDSLHGRYLDGYLRKLGRGEAAHLVHGIAWLRDDLEPEEPPQVGEPGDRASQDAAAAWFRPTRRAMLAAHGVGTVDQAMLAAMHVKFGFLRLFGLTDRVLVIDEVHAYDAYMSAIIGRLLQWCACLKIPVILLSATLSAKQRAAMIEAYGSTGGDPGPKATYPLITCAVPEKPATTIQADASSSRTLMFETHLGLLGDAKATAKWARELVENGGCCCVILNTVKQAQAVYAELGDLPKDQKLLFHARFTAADRERITKDVLDKFGKDTFSRPDKFILVATQVVEQSLDVDFDHMISEIAPMDLLLQRSGRMHRHRVREQNPTLHVLVPQQGQTDFGGTGFVYAAKPLLRTIALLGVRQEAILPSDFRALIEGTYGEERWESHETNWKTIEEADREWDRELSLMRAQGNQFCLCEPSPRIFRPVNNDPTGDDSDDGNGWRARTRLGANDRTTILVEEGELPRLAEGILRLSEVKQAYRRAVKTARYLPLHNPLEGYCPAVEGSERMKGVLLLPIDRQGVWRGSDENGNTYRVTYDSELGLLAGREG